MLGNAAAVQATWIPHDTCLFPTLSTLHRLVCEFLNIGITLFELSFQAIDTVLCKFELLLKRLHAIFAFLECLRKTVGVLLFLLKLLLELDK